MNYTDSHSHLADPRMESNVQHALQNAKAVGISTFIQGGIGPEDWDRQILLSKKYPEIKLCFGLHPYFVADHSEQDCEQALNQLARMLPKAVALGELGLDFRPTIMKDSQDRQFAIFEKQVELASFSHKPMVLHLVRAHEEALRCFDVWGVPAAKGMVHSFNGSAHQALQFLKLGLYLSVGGPVCRADNQRLHQAIREVPLESLLLETDSPDQPPPGIGPEENQPSSLILVAEKVAELKKLSKQEVLDRCSQNARKLFQL